MTTLLLLSVGGHGMVVAETALANKHWETAASVDNKLAPGGRALGRALKVILTTLWKVLRREGINTGRICHSGHFFGALVAIVRMTESNGSK